MTVGYRKQLAETAENGTFARDLGPVVQGVRKLEEGVYADAVMPVSNFQLKMRDTFEVYDGVAGNIWRHQLGNGDIVTLQGNALGCSWLTVSKSPFAANSNATITGLDEISLPAELVFGVHMSQRTVGQEFAIELIDAARNTPEITNLNIASIQQTASVLTVQTTVPHRFTPGMRFGVVGCTANSALNYPALTVATVVNATTFTATAGPAGTIPALTVGPFNVGQVFYRPALGYAANGAAMIFESANAAQASFFMRSDSGDILPSPVLNGNHSQAIALTVSVAAITSPGCYALQPTSEYRAFISFDRTQWMDQPVDSLAAPTSRYLRTQICPDNQTRYRVRIRANNAPSLTTRVGSITAVAKAGTTTATVTVPNHGLSAGDLVAAYGVRDQTNFPQLVAATAITNVTTNTFDVVWGGAVTANSQGGIVYRVNGGNLPSALGANASGIQSFARTANIMTVVGSVAFTGLVNGDSVDLSGLIDTGGVSLGVDGVYTVRDASGGTTLILEPMVAGSAPIGVDIVTTNCGGALVKRTDMRISFLRCYEREIERVEFGLRPSNDANATIPVSGSVGVSSLPALPTGANNIGSIVSVGTAGQPPAPTTPYFLNSAATTNGALIIAGTSAVESFYATNIGATPAFVKLYNKATAPVVGTDVPEMVIGIPAAVSGVPGFAEIPGGYEGYRFALGLGIAITGAAADSDTTAVAAGQVKVKLSRHV